MAFSPWTKHFTYLQGKSPCAVFYHSFLQIKASGLDKTSDFFFKVKWQPKIFSSSLLTAGTSSSLVALYEKLDAWYLISPGHLIQKTSDIW